MVPQCRLLGWAKEHWPILLILIPFAAWNAGQLNRDLWYDEVVDLNKFALADIGHTVEEYGGLHGNNHTLFNLVNNLYTRLIGIREIDRLSDRPWSLRILQFIIAIIGIGATYAVGKRFFSKNTAFLAGLILATSVPFLNFSLQLRGYNISMALVPLMLYLLWRYEAGPTRRGLLLFALSVFLFMYTMPSNGYLVASLGFLYTYRWVRRRQGLHLMILIGIGIGLALFIVAYSPLMGEFLMGKLAIKNPSSRFASLNMILPAVFTYVLSFRYLLLIPLLLGILPLYRGGVTDKDESKAASSNLYQLGILFLLPFFISFLRQDAPFQRTFVHLTPIWSLFFGAGISLMLEKIPQRPRYRRLVVAMIAAYCVATLAYANTHIQKRLYEALSKGIPEQNIFYSYYLSSLYTPSSVVSSFAQLHHDQPAPILLVNECDRMALHHYLTKHGLGYYSTIYMDEAVHQGKYVYFGKLQIADQGMDAPEFLTLETRMRTKVANECIMFTPLYIYLVRNGIVSRDEPRFYAITMSGEGFRRMIGRHYPGLSIEQVSEGRSCTNIIRVTRAL